MSIVRVAVPVYRGKRKFHIDKGRPWSVAEHVLLQAIATKSQTASELEEISGLPRRLIIEAIIRLMRAGWLELSQGTSGVVFRTNKIGSAMAIRDELPNAPKRIVRWLSFIVDRLTGTVFHGREMPPVEKHIVEARAADEVLVWIEPRESELREEVDQVVTNLFREDEKFISMDPVGDRLVERYVIVTVKDGKLEGLPSGATEELRSIILEAAEQAPERPRGAGSPSVRAPEPTPISERPLPEPRDVVFSQADLILGGEAHRKAIEQALKKANHRVIIHSTFINSKNFFAFDGLMSDAISRGAQIDVLWGEDEGKSEGAKSLAAANEIRDVIKKRGIEALLRIHPFSTGSHAKMVVADDGNHDRLHAVVGSCNWLSSSFASYEASVRLRDPQIVADVLWQLSELSRGGYGHWTSLTNELAGMANRMRSAPSPVGARAQASIVLGPQHAQYVRQARDDAKHSITVLSHRLGPVANAAVVVPAIAAAQSKKVKASLFFGRLTGAMEGMDQAELVFEARQHGVEIRPVHEPRLHAKVLAWDKDAALITSQNWLSADPAEGAIRQEIGVFIRAQNVARHLVEQFEYSRHP